MKDKGLAFELESFEAGALYGTTNQVRMSFIEYRYDLLQPLNYWNVGNCFLASLDDIACMKLAAAAQRGSRKDFIDVFVLGQRHKPLPELLRLYQQKYRVKNVALVLLGLAYFDDAEAEPDPLRWNSAWSEVKQTISGWVRGIE